MDARKKPSKKYFKAYGQLYGSTPAPEVLPKVVKRRSASRINPKVPSEAQEQVAFVDWGRIKRLPLVEIPNAGKRSLRQGALEKRMGLSPGFPDLQLLLRRKGFGALFIEMKRTVGGVISPVQAKWHKWLNENGYMCVVAKGCEHAIQLTEIYLAYPVE